MNDKTGRYFKYAIGEIILVVVGILIALSINTWNEERKSDKKEKSILEVLQLEFEANRESLFSSMEMHQKSTEAGFKLISYFNQDISTVHDSTFNSLLQYFVDAQSFDPRKGQLNSIISSGQINLISNEELTILLSSFEDMINDTKEELGAIRRLTEEFSRLNGEYLNFADFSSILYRSPKNDSFTSDYERLFKDIKMYNIIVDVNVWRNVMNDEEMDQLNSIDRLLELIKHELNN